MKVVGNASCRVFGPESEATHTPGEHPDWQESVYLTWFDLKSGIGGHHRLGSEPNSRDGEVALWNHLFATRGTVLKHTGVYPATPDSVGPTSICAGGVLRYECSPSIRWVIDDRHAKGELRFEDFHPPIEIFPGATGTVSSTVGRNHTESSGLVHGWIELDGVRCDIQGLGHRDHSWGVRNWSAIIAHRWFAGVFPERVSFSAISWAGHDDSMFKNGFLAADGVIRYAEDIDIVVQSEIDAFTHRGGTIRMRLPELGLAELRCTPLSRGVISVHRGASPLDTPCLVEYQGMRGYCCAEMTSNPTRGARIPRNLVNGILEEGLHHGVHPYTGIA